MDFEFYIDGKRCSVDEFLERVNVKNNQIYNFILIKRWNF